VEVTEVVLGKLSSVLSQYVVSFNYVEERLCRTLASFKH